VANVLESLGPVLARLFQQNFAASGMLVQELGHIIDLVGLKETFIKPKILIELDFEG
jgi:hypothetical protein